MYYNLKNIEYKIASNLILKEKKLDLIKFFNNILEKNILEYIFLGDEYPPYFINQQQLKITLDTVNLKYNCNLKIEDLYEGDKPLIKLNDDKKLKKISKDNFFTALKNHEEYSTYFNLLRKKEEEKNIVKQKKTEEFNKLLEIKKIQQKEEFNKLTNLTIDFDKSSILSIDFEFFLKDEKLYNVSELGITINKYGEKISRHYLIKENFYKKKNRNLQTKFDYGKTKYITENNIKNIIENLLKNTNHLLFHEKREELKIFKQLGITIPQDTNILDTQLIYKRYFSKKNEITNGEKLGNILNLFNIKHQHLHNAGNDAYFTLILLEEMSKSFKNQKKEFFNKKLKF